MEFMNKIYKLCLYSIPFAGLKPPIPKKAYSSMEPEALAPKKQNPYFIGIGRKPRNKKIQYY